MFGVACPLYIHAHILFLLHGAAVEMAPYRSEKEEGKGFNGLKRSWNPHLSENES
jgi:hypothetical protein